jgi:hypothetical protein
MKLQVQYSSLLLFFALASPPVFAQDLSDAFNKAREIVRDWKPASPSDDGRGREEREERPTDPAPERQPDQSAIERERVRQRREQERQRVQKNLELLDANLASAKDTLRTGRPEPRQPDDETGAVLARERELEALMDPRGTPTGIRLSAAARKFALENATVIRDAMSHGKKPAFRPLWNFYKYNRPIAYGLLPEGSKCAIAMSVTLGLEPRPGETSLQELGNKELVATLVGQIETMLVGPVKEEPVKDSEIAKRYYVKAEDMADRLKKEWGAPSYLDGKEARKYIAGRRGVIFLKNAYWRKRDLIYLGARGVTGDHIGLWDSDHLADSATTPFEGADKVWFWEIR